MGIIICACQFYHRIPSEKIAAVRDECAAAGVACEIVPDLCLASVRDRGGLDTLKSGDVVFACQSRAVRAMLGESGATATCLDLRTKPLSAILVVLPSTSVDNGAPSAGSRKIDAAPELGGGEPVAQPPSSDWIPWFPVIDQSRCVQCKKCVDFCLFGVYTVEFEKVRVKNPASCKTDCPACARICPQNAIMFPKSEEEKLNGSLAKPVEPSDSDNLSFRERLKHRKSLRLFKEDES